MLGRIDNCGRDKPPGFWFSPAAPFRSLTFTAAAPLGLGAQFPSARLLIRGRMAIGRLITGCCLPFDSGGVESCGRAGIDKPAPLPLETRSSTVGPSGCAAANQDRILAGVAPSPLPIFSAGRRSRLTSWCGVSGAFDRRLRGEVSLLVISRKAHAGIDTRRKRQHRLLKIKNR